jgi:hypothetical protein
MIYPISNMQFTHGYRCERGWRRFGMSWLAKNRIVSSAVGSCVSDRSQLMKRRSFSDKGRGSFVLFSK